MILYIYKK